MHVSAVESLLPFLKPGSRVLDVGSGSGYLTAVIAELVCNGEDGKVVGLEHIRELKEFGEKNLGKSEKGKSLLESAKVEFVEGDGRKGWVDGKGGETRELWDAIHVGAAAKMIHDPLIEQLKRPGRMFIPVEDKEDGDQWIWVIDKDSEGTVKKERLYGVRYVPLTDAPTK